MLFNGVLGGTEYDMFADVHSEKAMLSLVQGIVNSVFNGVEIEKQATPIWMDD